MLKIKPILAIATILVGSAAITALPGTSEAGRVGGPMVREVFIGKGQYEVFMVRFEGGKLAKVGVQNAGTADLDIRIIDPATLKVVAQDLSADNDAHVKFMPPVTKDYLVLVHNFSTNKSAKYVLFTN